MQALFDIILPVFVVIGLGYFFAATKVLGESAVDGIVAFAQNIAIPVLLFRAISQIDISASFSWPIVLSYYIGTLATFVAGYFGARLLFGRGKIDAIAIGFCCFFSNTVMLGLPITERAFGPDALAGNYAIIALHAPLCYLLGVSAMELARDTASSGPQKALRVLNAMLHNPFAIGIALGLFVNVTGLPLPGTVIAGLELVRQAALPAALFGLGGILFRYRPEGDGRTIMVICAVSLILQPSMVYLLGKTFGLDVAALRSAVLTAAMAPGVNTYVFAHMYGAAQRVVASSVLFATAASILTIWVWLLILP